MEVEGKKKTGVSTDLLSKMEQEEEEEGGEYEEGGEEENEEEEVQLSTNDPAPSIRAFLPPPPPLPFSPPFAHPALLLFVMKLSSRAGYVAMLGQVPGGLVDL